MLMYVHLSANNPHAVWQDMCSVPAGLENLPLMWFSPATDLSTKTAAYWPNLNAFLSKSICRKGVRPTRKPARPTRSRRAPARTHRTPVLPRLAERTAHERPHRTVRCGLLDWLRRGALFQHPLDILPVVLDHGVVVVVLEQRRGDQEIGRRTVHGRRHVV